MKRQKHYTLILSSNSAGAVKRLHFSGKALNIFFASLSLLSVLLLFLVTDYFGLIRNDMELNSLRDKNKKLRESLISAKAEFQQLKQEVFQLKDFNRKITLVADLSAFRDRASRHLSYGGVSSSAHLIRLARLNTENRSAAVTSHTSDKECREFSDDFAASEDLKIKIKNLRKEGRLLKQNTWDIYSSLLENKTLLSGTPSILPVRGGWISSRYGFRKEAVYADHDFRFHNGMDIAARKGSPVVATADGCVKSTSYDQKGYGKLIEIDHGNDVVTYYAHLSDIKIKQGQCVQRGQVIAAVGNTGKSTGPHLHYEVRVLGIPVDPELYHLDEDSLFSPEFLSLANFPSSVSSFSSPVTLNE